MTIIPVIDLAAGQVVHARAGLRADYQPLTATLAKDSDPAAVIAALRALYRFDSIYVADLDAIEGRSNHAGTLERLMQLFPRLEFWLDAGPATLEIATSLQAVRPVIGSENHDHAGLVAALGIRPDSVLSLDYRNGTFLGDERLARGCGQLAWTSSS
ncbi:MAG: HisA/HisF-related TIM barrel protein [Gammaproteobacteria bacterium]|nr:HisA/HisF-related TIM barrel protein [Gammaproteobacteria bacterium]